MRKQRIKEMSNKYQSMWNELKRRANTPGNEEGPAVQRWIAEIEEAEMDNLLESIFTCEGEY